MDITTPTPPDTTARFDDIRPYRDAEINAAVRRIADDGNFAAMMQFIYTDEQLHRKMAEFTTYQKVSEFQIKFMFDAINAVIDKTTDGFTFDGFDGLEKGRGYLIVSNHRDILLDAALLQKALYHNGLECSEITFGNNLMQPGFITDFGKSNRMFKVVRGGNAREFYEQSLHLSEYVRYTITERNTSIWIAQRNGRTKDGDDKTSQAVLKMFSLSSRQKLSSSLAPLNIVPMSISYQWETCVKQKVRELYLSQDKTYIKEEGEDQRSIINGIISHKGKIHIHIGKPLDLCELEFADTLERNDALAYLAALLDKRIYSGYKLFNNNYIAYDMLYNTFKYSDKYTPEEYRHFANVMHQTLDEWPQELLPLMETYLKIYSNPVLNKESVKDGTAVE